MAVTDRRGATLSLADPPVSTNPSADLAWKAPVRVASTGAPLNPATGGLLTVDGVALAVGDRVLCKDEADQTTNGIYNAQTGPWTRTIDAANNSQWSKGLLVLVTDGSTNDFTIWGTTAANPIVLGTTALTWRFLV